MLFGAGPGVSYEAVSGAGLPAAEACFIRGRARGPDFQQTAFDGAATAADLGGESGCQVGTR